MQSEGLPGLIVFDLDFTLWDCGGLWVDCTRYPFRIRPDGVVVDGNERILRFYDEVAEIFDLIDEKGMPIAAASRTEKPEWARELLKKLGHSNRFDFEEIYPGSKVAHFESLRRNSGLPYEEMLFFDDENRNIIEVGALGVKCIEVKSGMSREVFNKGIDLFS